MPERLDRFMARANAAYYGAKNPFADFTTAPEIGQVFGELLGAWAAMVWQQMGSPNPLLLAEAGPGQGTLMADILRTTARVAPEFHAAARVHFIETSPRLRNIQATRVPDAVWHDALDTLPAGPMILIANEFLDALPIRQFERRASGWTERHVQGGAFVNLPAGAPSGDPQHEGIYEVCEAALAWTLILSRRLATQGGAALVLDYGYVDGQPGDTLQALRNGKPADPLGEPGEADLTAHVDFKAVARMAQGQGAKTWGPVAQGDFLAELGLHARTAQLAAANPDLAGAFYEAADRLAGADRMGQLFKVLCLTGKRAPAPAGFECYTHAQEGLLF